VDAYHPDTMHGTESPPAFDGARSFDTAYEGTPSWELGRAQPAVTRAVDAGLLGGDVLDVGCGTGENARWLADAGMEVVGVDFSARGIERALAGPATTARFIVADARDLAAAGFGPDGRSFSTVLDVGCFHSLQVSDRDRYATSVRGALRPNGCLVLVCWSDLNEFGRGPARVTRAEIRDTFADGWVVDTIEPEILESRLSPGSVAAWLAAIRRTDAGASARAVGPAPGAGAGRRDRATGCSYVKRPSRAGPARSPGGVHPRASGGRPRR